MTSELMPGFHIGGTWQSMLFAGFILSLLMLLVAPVLKILFIPINLITFGLLSWLINVVVVYLLTVFVPAVTVVEWTFPGLSWVGFVIPSAYISYVPSLILSSLAITFFSNLLHSLSED